MGCVSSSVHEAIVTGVRDKLEATQHDLQDAQQRIRSLEDEVRRVRGMDTSQRVMHEQKLRMAAERRLVQQIKEQQNKEARARAAAAAAKLATDQSARNAGILAQIV